MRGEERKGASDSTPFDSPRPTRSHGFHSRSKGEHFTLWVYSKEGEGESTEYQLGVSRRFVRLATERNRWRRRIREVFRRHKKLIQPGYQLSLKLHSPERGLSYAKLEKEILELLKRSKMLIE